MHIVLDYITQVTVQSLKYNTFHDKTSFNSIDLLVLKVVGASPPKRKMRNLTSVSWTDLAIYTVTCHVS